MVREVHVIYGCLGCTIPYYEREEPTHDLYFSGGSPLVPAQLSDRQQRCLSLTVDTRLFESPNPWSHYWFSRDMDWWASTAKMVLDDLHLLLTRHGDEGKSFLFKVSLFGPWRCGPWKSDATWLSRFVHRYYEAEGTVLHPLRNKVDKHLKDVPDTLRFDIFLLQCWSDLVLSEEQESTRDLIGRINEEPPEICVEAIQKHMDMLAPAEEQRYRLRDPMANEPWLTRPSARLDDWARLQPELARENQAMFMEYTRHLITECELELEEGLLGSRNFPRERRNAHFVRSLVRISSRIVAYIDCVIILAQQELGMVRGPGLSSGSSSSVSSLGPPTPPNW